MIQNSDAKWTYLPATPSSPLPVVDPLLFADMAVFELDPTPWLPWGHQVIDGGVTRLPRSYYNPQNDPPQQHQSYCIAVVEPAPHPLHQGIWRDRVRDLLVGPLNRQVLDVQPSVFGVGLFQLGSPHSREALVQHGAFNLLNNSTVRFVNVDECEENHRVVQGFRTGWLMFLGIPPDYRNDYDITNAVPTFGKFHYWSSDDPIKSRALVYASFPSPALVPRDVVFGKFASVGGVRKSWTAAVYILTADFAEALPADEDQMPPDGNPHPLPGHLIPNLNAFVGPQFPELGWDDVQVQQPDNLQQNGLQQNVGNDVDQMVDDQESMVLNPSGNSSSSANVQPQMNNQILQVGLVRTSFIGPMIPPDLQWKRLFQDLLPEILAKNVPLALQVSPFQSLLLCKCS
jgi:hypothetical protein